MFKKQNKTKEGIKIFDFKNFYIFSGPDADMTVLYTDYKNIALIYKCQQLPFNVAHRLSASVLVTDKAYNDTKEMEKVKKFRYC